MDQIIEWLGGEAFDGCLCFDECHKAKNYIPGVASKSTKVAANVIELQNKMPMARVVYCSATGVSGVGDMAYIDRLGLWGPSTAFKDFTEFYNCMKRRGVSFLEMLSMELKSEGKYIARSLSFKGTEFEAVTCDLGNEEVLLYDAAAKFWQVLQRRLETALRLTDASGNAQWKNYWSAHQRFFRHLCIALKVRFVVDIVSAHLSAGYAVVIGLQSTGEAALNASDLALGQTCHLVSTARVMLETFIENHFPITSTPSSDAPDRCSVKECVEMKKVLLADVEKLQLPDDFLDKLIADLGGSKHVAEMTGRQSRIEKEGSSHYVLKQRSMRKQGIDSINVSERQQFMSGKKLVAIVSDAGSTGISLHADRNCENQRRRVHITIELPWSADKAIQQLGRTHRSNQVTAPIYQLVCTNIGGEQRFLSAVARRLESLGALTRGDRRAASGVDMSDSHFDSHYGRIALRRMYDYIVQESESLPLGVSLSSVLENTTLKASLDIDEEEGQEVFSMHCELRKHLNSIIQLVDSPAGKRPRKQFEERPLGTTGKEATDVRKFLNRLLGLKIAQQTLLFNYFFQTLKSVISAAKKEGLYTEGVSDVYGKSITRCTEPSIIWVDPVSQLTTYKNEFIIDRGMPFQDACQLLELERGLEDASGFYRSRNCNFGSYAYLLAIQTSRNKATFKIYRPNTGPHAFEMSEEQLHEQHMQMDASSAEHEWTEKYETSLETCTHGYDCQRGDRCQVGRRRMKITVLSGSVVRVWGVLENVLQRHQPRLNKSDSILKVVRVPLKEETPLIGVKFPEELLSEVIVALAMHPDVGDPMKNADTNGHRSGTQRETAAPIQVTILKKLTKQPKTLMHYFSKRQSPPSEDVIEEPSIKKRKCVEDDINRNE